MQIQIDHNSFYLNFNTIDPDLRPYYEYFAERIQDKESHEVEEFKIVNYFLPPSWLGDKIIPALETVSEDSLKGITNLELSNCSLCANDLDSLVRFLRGNETLLSLDLSRNDIESGDTVIALAKAIKDHPMLSNVSLAYCSLAGGDIDALKKMLAACKQCNSLELGCNDFTQEGVATVAEFLGKKNFLTSFSLAGAKVDKSNKQLLTKALVKNKSIKKLGLHSNDIKLPAILDGTKKLVNSMGRLTHLDLTSNSLPIQGVKSVVKFLEKTDPNLVSLNLSKNRLTTKGANILLPAIKKHTSLQRLDLSKNWLNDEVSTAVIDLLKNNSDLRTFDLSGNKSLKTQSGGRYNYFKREYVGGQDRGRARIVKTALFNTTSLNEIANSNHICAVKISVGDVGDTYENTVYKINSLDASVGKKIRFKIVLAINEANRGLFNPFSFDNIPLELMPRLLELIQQQVTHSEDSIVIKHKTTNNEIERWMQSEWDSESGCRILTRSSLNRIFETITAWNTPLLFARGAGEIKTTKRTHQIRRKKLTKRRRKFGDDEDEDDEPWIPSGARKRCKVDVEL